MQNPSRGFAGLILIAIIALVLIGGGAVWYQNRQSSSGTTGTSSLASSTSPSNQQVTMRERDAELIDRISSVYSKDNSYTLVYHDDATVAFVFAVPAGKSPVLIIADAHTLKQIDTRIISMWDAIQTPNYIISVGTNYISGVGTVGDAGTGLIYYKKGSSDVEMISGSILPANETYLKENGDMGSSVYDLHFDESSKTLSASVFKPNSGNPNEKIRTATFNLP